MKHITSDCKIKEECGVFSIINSPLAANSVYLGLHSLQHRGQDSSGIATFDNDKEYCLKKIGSVINSFDKRDLESLKGNSGIGHVRYSTFGSTTNSSNVQPFIFKSYKYTYITCHNGNLTNAKQLRSKLEEKGSVFFSDTDSEIIGHLINFSKKPQFIDKLKDALSQMDGAFSFVILLKDKMYGCRDKYGFRPLVLGKKDNSYIFASETVALDIIQAEHVRDVNSAEIVEITLDGQINSVYYTGKKKDVNTFCAMEYIYFSRPDSNYIGKNVHQVRVNLGKQLAKEHPAKADLVIGVPDSSLSSAIGYSLQSKIPYETGLIKNRYVARSFIVTSPNRSNIVRVKLNPNKYVLKGKRIVLVDDSIVRGTTMGIIAKLIHDAGAKEIHIRIVSPELKWPCFYGVDIKTKKELSLASQTKEQYKQSLKYVDSLEFISLEGLQKAIGLYTKKHQLCTSCFTGKYLTKLYSNKKD